MADEGRELKDYITQVDEYVREVSELTSTCRGLLGINDRTDATMLGCVVGLKRVIRTLAKERGVDPNTLAVLRVKCSRHFDGVILSDEMKEELRKQRELSQAIGHAKGLLWLNEQARELMMRDSGEGEDKATFILDALSSITADMAAMSWLAKVIKETEEAIGREITPILPEDTKDKLRAEGIVPPGEEKDY